MKELLGALEAPSKTNPPVVVELEAVPLEVTAAKRPLAAAGPPKVNPPPEIIPTCWAKGADPMPEACV